MSISAGRDSRLSDCVEAEKGNSLNFALWNTIIAMWRISSLWSIASLMRSVTFSLWNKRYFCYGVEHDLCTVKLDLLCGVLPLHYRAWHFHCRAWPPHCRAHCGVRPLQWGGQVPQCGVRRSVYAVERQYYRGHRLRSAELWKLPFSASITFTAGNAKQSTIGSISCLGLSLSNLFTQSTVVIWIQVFSLFPHSSVCSTACHNINGTQCT